MTLILTNWVGETGLPDAIQTFTKSRSALDAIEAGMITVERDPAIPYVGRGGLPNSEGVMEFDAGVMNGTTREVGAIGAFTRSPHVFRVARKLMETLPHVLLVGEGANSFAEEMNIPEEASLTEDAKKEWHLWKEQVKDLGFPKRFQPLKSSPHAFETKDTVVYIVQDYDGQFFTGTSTSGWPFKYPGRLGDSPVCGAGFYADSRYGACVCTCTGEMTIRHGTARAVVATLKSGASAQEACLEAVSDLRSITAGFTGDVCVHVVDTKGDISVKMSSGAERDCCLWRDGFSEYQRVAVECVGV